MGSKLTTRNIFIDTDIMIDYLRGNKKAVSFVNERTDRIIFSPIVVAELYAGVKGEQEQTVLDELFSLFPVIPLTMETARVGGLLKRDFEKSHGIGLPDAILAATVQSEKAELGTLNVKHYPMMKRLKPAYVKK